MPYRISAIPYPKPMTYRSMNTAQEELGNPGQAIPHKRSSLSMRAVFLMDLSFLV